MVLVVLMVLMVVKLGITVVLGLSTWYKNSLGNFEAISSTNVILARHAV